MLLNHIMYYQGTTLNHALRSVGLTPRKLYCFDVRYSLRDFGWIPDRRSASEFHPSMGEVLATQSVLKSYVWGERQITELRNHPKTSARYGFLREQLPALFTWRVPASLNVGHEIYALAEKTEAQR